MKFFTLKQIKETELEPFTLKQGKETELKPFTLKQGKEIFRQNSYEMSAVRFIFLHNGTRCLHNDWYTIIGQFSHELGSHFIIICEKMIVSALVK